MRKDLNTILDFDGTICKLDVDWVALKTEVHETFNGDYRFKSPKLLPMINTIFEHGSDKERLLSIIQKYEQPKGVVQFSSVNTRLLNTYNLFYIISNNLTSTVDMVIRELNLIDRCLEVVGIDLVQSPKPSDNPFKVLQNKKPYLNSENCLYIGDSETDYFFTLNCNLKFLNVININGK